MANVSVSEGRLPKTKQILAALEVDGSLCYRQLKERFGDIKSILRNLENAGCVEKFAHFNPNIKEAYARKEVNFYAATGIPYVTKRMPVKKQPPNYRRDKERSTRIIPECIEYLEKWGYEVIYKGESK